MLCWLFATQVLSFVQLLEQFKREDTAAAAAEGKAVRTATQTAAGAAGKAGGPAAAAGDVAAEGSIDTGKQWSNPWWHDSSQRQQEQRQQHAVLLDAERRRRRLRAMHNVMEGRRSESDIHSSMGPHAATPSHNHGSSSDGSCTNSSCTDGHSTNSSRADGRCGQAGCSHGSSASEELPLGLRRHLADLLWISKVTALEKRQKRGTSLPDAVLDAWLMREAVRQRARWGQGADTLSDVPLCHPVIAHRHRVLQQYVDACEVAVQAMKGRKSAEEECPLCLLERQRPQDWQQQQQQQRWQAGQHASTNSSSSTEAAAADVARSSGATAHHNSSHLTPTTSSSDEATAAIASDGAGNNGSSNASSSSSSSSSASISSEQPLPLPADPFYWRALMWRVFSRLKPSSAAALRRLGACHHVDDPRMWNCVMRSLEHSLLPMQHAEDRALFHPSGEGERQRIEQYARAISHTFVQVRWACMFCCVRVESIACIGWMSGQLGVGRL